MTGTLRNQFLFVLILSLACLYLVVPIEDKPLANTLLKNFKINLGIDLNGGAEVWYKGFDPNNLTRAVKREEMQTVAEIIRKRIDNPNLGLKEPKINVRGADVLMIQIAGVDPKTWEDYKNLIATMGKLELKEVAEVNIHEEAKKLTVDWTELSKVPEGYQALKNIERGEGKDLYKDFEYILVKQDPVVTGRDIKSASTSPDMKNPGKYQVNFRLKGDGAKRFKEVTARLSKPPEEKKGQIAIILDGAMISRPTVQSQIEEEGQITGNYTQRSAEELANILNTGSLPLALGKYDDKLAKWISGQPVYESLIGPTLGQDSIKRGIYAVTLSFIIVAVIMIIYYRALGFIAVIILALNVTYLMTIMILLGATLTLPGIAGIVLTVGMAVDANILIYERMREELAKNKTLIQSLEHGFDRALSAITDSNVTTLIAAFWLYLFGTGPVKGFATTLSIGIFTTLFSVLFCGKIFLKMLIYPGSIKRAGMLQIVKNPSFNFLRLGPVCIVLSLIAIIASIVLFAVKGDESYGIDFKGGSIVNFRFSEPQQIDFIRKKINDIKDEKGLPKYADAEVQTVLDPGESLVEVGKFTSRQFQMRSRFENINEIKADILNVFKDQISHDPFQTFEQSALSQDEQIVYGKEAGGGLYMYVYKQNYNFQDLEQKIKDSLATVLTMNNDIKQPYLLIKDEPYSAINNRIKMIMIKDDLGDQAPHKIRAMQQKLEELVEKGLFKISESPFVAEDTIGPSVAKELRNSSIWALLTSWISIIIYIWIRFYSFKFGFAAVIALIHDAIISIGFVILAGIVVPKAWGLNFDLSMVTIAAVLTIIGFSVNDTVVIYDRIRENLLLMKRSPLADIINTSVNQTLSRTIMTSLTAWVSCVCLYVVTMTSSGGVSGLAFPLIIGMIVGVYSTVYIAGWIVNRWQRGQMTAVERR